LKALVQQFEGMDVAEGSCCLAAWKNYDADGAYLTIELSPKYVRREHRPQGRNTLSFIFDDDEEAQ
jgi:hypothetical protein